MAFEFVATCLFGLEKFLGEEIDALGYTRTETMDGRVTFSGDISAVARCNINLRCAERLYIKVGSFPAESFEELFEGTKKLPFEDWIGKDDAFPVKGHSVKSKLFSVPDCQSIIKKAIVKRLESAYHISWFEETETKYQIEFFIFKDTVNLMIDTSGEPLHKRGYRPQSVAAPLRETLAASLALTSRPRENVLLWDPFCGSATIPIEAAMIMANIAPGLNHNFISETFRQIPANIWESAREEAKDKINYNSAFEAYASDIDPECVEIALASAKRAGVEKFVKIFRQDALSLTPLDRRGTIVCNPPYGERLMTIPEVETLYKKMGKVFSALAPWQIYVLTSYENFEKCYGKRADKIRKLYNGMIPCNLYQYFKNSKNT